MSKVVDAQQAIVKALFANVVKEYGRDCVAIYRSAGSVGEYEVRTVEPDGHLSPNLPGGGRVGMAWHRLREAMAEGSAQGAWLQVTVRVSTDGRYSFDFDYDSEPTWFVRPLDETLIADLEDHPRPVDQIPTWHPAHPSHKTP